MAEDHIAAVTIETDQPGRLINVTSTMQAAERPRVGGALSQARESLHGASEGEEGRNSRWGSLCGRSNRSRHLCAG